MFMLKKINRKYIISLSPDFKAHILRNVALNTNKLDCTKIFYFKYKYLRETVNNKIVENFPRKF